MKQQNYTTQLQAGSGLIDKTIKLLILWEPGMDHIKLFEVALESGQFPNISARRLKNLVHECFAIRYLGPKDYPVKILKQIKNQSSKEFFQILFIFTSRANLILRDFVLQVYWLKYAEGHEFISKEDAINFVINANNNGKTIKPWAETTIKNIASYLIACCCDYGLLEPNGRTIRKILPFKIEDNTTAFLSYDLHFSGLGDNAVVAHPDWQLFGLEKEDVKHELKKLALKNYYILQSAGDLYDIYWKFKNWEEFLDVFNQ